MKQRTVCFPCQETRNWYNRKTNMGSHEDVSFEDFITLFHHALQLRAHLQITNGLPFAKNYQMRFKDFTIKTYFFRQMVISKSHYKWMCSRFVSG